MIRFALAFLTALLLAACGGSGKPAPAADQRGAAGDVQPGSISDAMIPLDTVKSQSPPLKIAPSDSAGGNGAAAAATGAAVAEPDAVTEGGGAASPAATPAPAPKN